MNFSYELGGNRIDGELRYLESEASIDFEPSESKYRPGNDSHSSCASLIASHYLQVDFQAEDGRLLYAWGYCAKDGWEITSGHLAIRAEPGEVFVHDVDDPVAAGVGYDTDLRGVDARFFKDSGHLVIGEPKEADTLIEIATDTVIGLKGDQLCCVVLKPVMT